MKRNHTETSTFGVSRRESHNAKRYYDRALVTAETTTTKNVTVTDDVNWIDCGDSRDMSRLPDNSVALMVTSPSYHVGKDYDTDDSFTDFLSILEAVFTETYRVLEDGGRAAINVANLGRKPYVLFSDLIADMCKDIGFLPRGEIIWVKAAGAAGSTAFGSWRSPANPVLRDLHEYILVFSKGRFDRAHSRPERRKLDLPNVATITKEDFLESTLSVWNVRPESARRVGHPAPFPVELPRRLIELYTYRDDLVLDPFMGSGTTAVAAKSTGRSYCGFDLDQSYVDLATQRITDTPAPPDPEQEVTP